MKSTFKQELILPFLDEIKDMKLSEMIDEARSRAQIISDQIRELKYHGESEEFSQALKFYHDLKGLLYFLEHKDRPETVQPKRFQRFKWIAQKLVNKGEIEDYILEKFNWD
jgi:hypothetical protein